LLAKLSTESQTAKKKGPGHLCKQRESGIKKKVKGKRIDPSKARTGAVRKKYEENCW